MTTKKDNDESKVIASSDLSSFIREKDGTFRMELTTGKADSSPSAIKKFALFRLGYDLHECRTHPLPMIAAEPLNEDTDLWNWHANLVGPPGSSYEDICFHFKIAVPKNYPASPPKIEICSTFEHPNVFGKWICLDMLQGQWIPDDKKQTAKDIGYGWTPAYTMQSILVQLQAFLFDAVDTTFWAQISEKYSYTSTTQRARAQAKLFKCNECKHTGKKPWPEPLCWKDRLRYMVPGNEMADVAKTKQEFWNFLETINSLVTANEWPRIIPLECGSFFSWTLLPWYDTGYTLLKTIKAEKGVKSMDKSHSKVIRGLINRSITYLNQKPKAPPNKGLMLAQMYRIESAIDIAINNTYNTKNKLRSRGYWQWIKKDIANIKVENNSKTDSKQDEKKEEIKEEWIDFPVNISQQIEALYCRWQSDLRRPGQLVEIKTAMKNSNKNKNKSDKKTTKKSSTNKPEKKENKQDLEEGIFANGRKYGIVTKPRGYHWHVLRDNKLSEEEKKQKYKPYSSDDNKVRVMTINPLRTKQDKVMWWMNGPHYVTGKTTWIKYKIDSSKNNKRKFTEYIWKKCMILNRFQDKYGKWFIVVHPMPQRSDINKKSEMICINNLKIKSEGTYYKGYIRGGDNKYYIINIEKNKCRCIDDQCVYKIRRCIKKRTTQELWKEILIQSNCDKVDVPWKQKENDEIKALPKMDPIKYIGKGGAFIDLSMDNLPEEYYSDEEQEEKKNEKIISGMDDDTKQIPNDSNVIIPEIGFPKIGQKVIGRVIKKVRKGIFIDIGYIHNGQPIYGFLHISQVKCPTYVIDKKIVEHRKRKEEEEIAEQKYEEYLRKQAKKKKKKRRKKALQNKKNKENETNKTENKQPQQQQNEPEPEYIPPAPIAPQYRKPFSLPRNCYNIGLVSLRPGDIINDLYIYDTDSAINEIQLTQFMPLSYLEIGSHIKGHVRSVLSYAAFVDVGCESDAFLHKTVLEDAYKNRIIFDASNNISIGEHLELIVTNINCENNKMEVKINSESQFVIKNNNNRLILPDDFDESIAVYYSIFGLLSDDINDLIFSFVNRGDLHRLRKCCQLFERIIDTRSNLRFEIEELKCFHSKKNFRSEILGFGVRVERYPNSAMICDIEPKLDLLSATSYNSFTVRMNVWKEPFSHWLPVYINKSHGLKSLIWAKRSICDILNDPKYAKEYKDWNPYYVLKIIPTLMNTMIVRTMKGQLHESIVALEGYTMFYHLLLAFIIEYPYLQDFIDLHLGKFNEKTENNINRNKKHVKSLGEWIALLSTSNKYCWNDVCTAYLRECFDRNAKWILTANKKLLDENIPKKQRLTKSFAACQVSLKLCMFHVVFLRLFRYSARSGTLQSVKITKEKLDKLYGRPTTKMRVLLQKNVKRIKKIRNWKQFFDGIGIKCPSDDELFEWLIQSMRNSELKGYHKPYWFTPKKKRKNDSTMGGMFDKFDDAGDAWSAKQFGSDVQQKKGVKKKKMSTADQMMADF